MSPYRTTSLQVPRFVLWLFGLAVVAPWIVIGAWIIGHQRETSGINPPTATHTNVVTPTSTAATAPADDVVACKPGPWGKLEYTRILIEPPEEFILADYTRTEIRPWFFKGYSVEALDALFSGAGLEPAQHKYLADPVHREIRTDAIVITPDRDLILGLSTAARAKIYGALSAFPENISQQNPYRLRSDAVDGWLEDADLPADVIALTRKLFYQRGTATCFSDEAIVLPMLSTASQRTKYIKVLSRKTALVVQLRVGAEENVEPLVAYWGVGGRSKDLKPLLQSVARRPKGGTIDIVHLVPRFARLLVYTFPLPSERPIDANHDCHWTSFNFQNELPDERFSNLEYVHQVLFDQYYPVLGEPKLGDIIMFVRPDGVVAHSCVYIADDIVFTKNGPAFSVPWLLTRLADVQAFYAATGGVEVRRYRPKNL
jgi:hypothetical protein